MKKYIHIIAFFTLSIMIVSCGSDEKKAVVNTTPAINVKVSKVGVNNNNPFLSVSGKIQASKSAELSTRIMGFVKNVHVNVGDKVSENQLLVSINNSDLQAKKAQVNAGIVQAKTAFINAEKNYNRFKNLLESNSVTQKEMDDMTANYQMAKAGLEVANQQKNEIDAQFKYSNITAPFSGIVTSKNIKKGDMANPGMTLISIENPTNFEVLAMVPESEIAHIQKETEVTVLVKSINKTLQGKVTEISTSAKNTGGQYLVKIKLEKTPANILSGMFSTIQFPVERKETSEMVLIPMDAIVKKGQLTGIYTVSESKTALLRWLRLGKTYGNEVEVLSGLNVDESYIVSAEGKLFNGAKISLQ